MEPPTPPCSFGCRAMLELEGYQSFKPGYVLSAYARLCRLRLSAMLPEKLSGAVLFSCPGVVGGGLWLLGLSLRGSWAAIAYVAGLLLVVQNFPPFSRFWATRRRNHSRPVAITTMLIGFGVTGRQPCLAGSGTAACPCPLSSPSRVMFAAVSLIGGILVAQGGEKPA